MQQRAPNARTLHPAFFALAALLRLSSPASSIDLPMAQVGKQVLGFRVLGFRVFRVLGFRV